MRRATLSSARAAAAALATLLLACSGESGTGPDEGGPLAGRAFVVNSIGGTLSIVGQNLEGRLEARNDAVALGAGANAVSLAVGQGTIAVPIGGTSRLVLLEEATLAPRCAADLPAGSSPNGVVIQRAHAYVSLLNSGSVARVDLSDCGVEAVAPVGPAPGDLEALGDDVLVVVSNIDLLSGTFPVPRLGPSYVAFLDGATLEVQDTVSTGGFNAQFAAFDRDGDLLVVNTGDFGAANSSVAVLDPNARRLSGTFPIGDSAVDIAVSATDLAYVSSFSDGVYMFDAAANQVVRGRSDALAAPCRAPQFRGSAGVAVDRRGNVLSVSPGDFATPGCVFLFDADGALADSAALGVGPVGIQLETAARPD